MSADNVFSSGEMQLVTFALGQEIFGIDIMNVQEIIRIPAITVVPQAAGYVEGVTNLRGHILPVIDTRTKFGMEKAERGVSSRVIVVDVKGKTVGLSVDAVSEVLRIESDRIEEAPAAVSGVDASSITGVVKLNDNKKLAMILDVAKICSIEQPTNSESLGFRKGMDLSNINKEERKLEEVQLVSFLLGNEEFGLEIETVREIIRYPEIVKVPNVSHYIKGLISLRDTLMPIIDMRVKFDMGKDEITGSTRVVVADLAGTLVGLIVDKVYEVTRVPKDTIFPPPGALGGDNGSRLKGIARLEGGKRIIMLMDLQDVISSEELQDIEHLENGAAGLEEEGNFDREVEEQMVVFRLAGEQFGVRITQVQEINRLSNITKVPRAPEYVEGVVNLRGDVIPVIDLRKRFQMESKEYNEFTRVIVSDINKKKVGLIVDEVLEVLRVPEKYLEETPDILQDKQIQRFMDGIANLEKRMILMLNLENILVEKEWQKIAQLGDNEIKTPAKTAPKLKKQGRKALDD